MSVATIRNPKISKTIETVLEKERGITITQKLETENSIPYINTFYKISDDIKQIIFTRKTVKYRRYFISSALIRSVNSIECVN